MDVDRNAFGGGHHLLRALRQCPYADVDEVIALKLPDANTHFLELVFGEY